LSTHSECSYKEKIVEYLVCYKLIAACLSSGMGIALTSVPITITNIDDWAKSRKPNSNIHDIEKGAALMILHRVYFDALGDIL
jgi:hypothetical protein